MHVTFAFQICIPNWHFKLVFQISNSELQFACVIQTNMSNYNITIAFQIRILTLYFKVILLIGNSSLHCNVVFQTDMLNVYFKWILTVCISTCVFSSNWHFKCAFKLCISSLTTKQTQHAPKPTHHTGPAFTKHKLQQLRAMWEHTPTVSTTTKTYHKCPISQSASFNSCMQRENGHLQQANKHNTFKATNSQF